MTKTNKTLKIAGKEITLEAGKRYVASRPFATRRDDLFPVSINIIAPSGCLYPTHKVGTMRYDEANQFLSAFNNGTFGFEGRVW